MISFRCRKHREPVQRLWQVAKDGRTGLAGRPLEGVYREGLTPGAWVKERRKLTPGLYCRHCLEARDTAPLPDYDDQDLKDAGLLDTPHIGQSADDFDLEAAWKQLAKPLSKLLVATRDRAASLARCDPHLRSDAQLHADLRTALYGRVLGGGDLWTIKPLPLTPLSPGRMWSWRRRRPAARACAIGCRS